MNAIASPQRFDRGFYFGTALVFLGLVFWAFARTYYLKVFFDTLPLTLLLQIHGAVMSGWVVLLVAQSGLIAAHRVKWHRRLGVFGAAWAVLVVILGTTMTLHAATREVRGHTHAAAMQVTILGLELMQMLLFAIFVGTAIGLRHRTDYHKRLMLLTIACMVPSAFARLPFMFDSMWLILMFTDLFVLACIGIDTLRHHRLHPAFAWGAALFLAALNLTFYAVQTPAWIALGSWLVS